MSAGGKAMPYFYKAVPKAFLKKGQYGFIDKWEGIQATGLDPGRAGCLGGATASAMAVRAPTQLDKNYTWVSEKIDHARTYALDKFVTKDPVILRIAIPDDWVAEKRINNHGTAGWGTAEVIVPDWIEFESEPDKFSAIKDYNGHNAHITKQSSGSDSDSD
jgi:hypothetical protein